MGFLPVDFGIGNLSFFVARNDWNGKDALTLRA